MTINAQKRNNDVLSLTQKSQLATDLTNQGSYYIAIEQLKILTTDNPKNIALIQKLGEAYYHARDYDNAIEFLGKLPEINDCKIAKKGAKYSSSIFYYADALKYQGRYEEALLYFENFSKGLFKDFRKEYLRVYAKNELISTRFAIANREKPIDAKIENIGNVINKGYSDFSPRLENDTVMVFSSIPEDTVIIYKHGFNHYNHTKILKSNFIDSVWQTPEEIKQVNTEYEHNANGWYDTDHRYFYFSRCNEENHKLKCKIYRSEVMENQLLGKPKKIKGLSGNHTYSQPCVVNQKTNKGTTTTIYFSSDMKGTKGGTDIFFCTIDEKGNASKPVNCGPRINTVRDETSPFFDSKTDILYFSSNFHPGFGGYDIFWSKGSNASFSQPKNMMMPINSTYDDTYFSPKKTNNNLGFLVSNRLGGTPLLSPTCCDDIYQFDIKPVTNTIITLMAIDSITGKPIVGFNHIITLNNEQSQITGTENGLDTMAKMNDTTLYQNHKIMGKIKNFYSFSDSKNAMVTISKTGYKDVTINIITDNNGIIDTIIGNGVKYLRGKNDQRVEEFIIWLPKIKLIPIKPIIPKSIIKDTAKSKILVAINQDKKIDVKSKNKSNIAKTTITEAQLDQIIKEKTIERNKEIQNTKSKTENTITDKIVFTNPEKVKEKIVKKEKPILEIDQVLNLQFEYNKPNVIKQHINRLDSIARLLIKYPKSRIKFTTHTDSIGSDDYNVKLSDKRSQYIINHIAKKGVSISRMKGKGVGETDHIAPNSNIDGSDNPEGRQENRRTDIKVDFY